MKMRHVLGPKASAYQLRIASHHEAGHAVYAVLSGATQCSAIIRPDSSGLCTSNLSESDLFTSLAYSLAGPIAEGYFTQTDTTDSESWNGDLLTVTRLHGITHAGIRKRQEYYSAIRHTKEVVSSHWRIITELASTLFHQREISGNEIFSVFNQQRRQQA
ncbi:MAG: M50 family metallopeptidase [Gammaproteobacteria bacterium]|nr:M50 family metallopeptidase [Gammaproteobacteria bacterium]MDH5801521.1 M50 family metallopeptidase [Gammaproteobacteria bacterium]